MKTIRIVLAVLAFSLMVVGSYAQDFPKADLSVGYSYLDFDGSNGISGAGFHSADASIAFNANRWLGVVGDFGVGHTSSDPSVYGGSATYSSYTLGPRFSLRATPKVVPFVEALAGIAHVSAGATGYSTSDNPLVFGFGGGADISITHSNKLALRPQVDYFGFRTGGFTSNAERISIGLVFNL
jgi:hypothetical protein